MKGTEGSSEREPSFVEGHDEKTIVTLRLFVIPFSRIPLITNLSLASQDRPWPVLLQRQPGTRILSPEVLQKCPPGGVQGD